MSTKMLLTAKLEQRLVMSQQLTQAITLLQYNTLDLKQLVQQYIETNPLIDIEDIEANENNTDNEATSNSTNDNEDLNQLFTYSAASSKNNYNYNDDSSLENFAIPKSLRSHLLEQTLLCKFNPLEQKIAEAIIDAIDENGKLVIPVTEIQQTVARAESPALDLIHSVLKKIQTFDPAGIGHRDLCECLLIQLDHIQFKDGVWTLANAILTEYFEYIANNNLKILQKKLGMSSEQINEALKLIRSLNPKPGSAISNDDNINIEPELHVKKIKSKWRVYLSESILTNIKINQQYHELIKQNKKHDSFNALNKELQEAQWLLKGLKRRNETLLNVATHIFEIQHDFLEHGKSFMKPMNIIDVSQALNLHESTVSRVTTGKYIATPRGVFELKYFFPSYVLTQSGNTCSDTAVKEMIKDIIAKETNEHIHSDSEIADILKKNGLNIARRTVAKYRDALKILPSYQRATRLNQYE